MMPYTGISFSLKPSPSSRQKKTGTVSEAGVSRGRAVLSGARIASMNAQRGISKSRFLKEF
jgi:hypothetical protein